MAFWRAVTAFLVCLPFVYRELLAQFQLTLKHWKLMIAIGIAQSVCGQIPFSWLAHDHGGYRRADRRHPASGYFPACLVGSSRSDAAGSGRRSDCSLGWRGRGRGPWRSYRALAVGFRRRRSANSAQRCQLGRVFHPHQACTECAEPDGSVRSNDAGCDCGPGALLAGPVLGEAIEAYHVIGLVLVCAGVFLTNRAVSIASDAPK